MLNEYAYLYTSQDRPRREATASDKIYKEFLDKIVKLMGIKDKDEAESEAKKYRSLIKLDLEIKRPALQGRQNDEKKMEEMKKIMDKLETKKDFDAYIKNIDTERIRKHMDERKAESDKRRAEKNKDIDKNSDRKGKKGDTTTDTDNNTSDEMTSEAKEKKSKKSKSKMAEITSESEDENEKVSKPRSRIAEQGYLLSEDLLFSSAQEDRKHAMKQSKLNKKKK